MDASFGRASSRIRCTVSGVIPEYLVLNSHDNDLEKLIWLKQDDVAALR